MPLILVAIRNVPPNVVNTMCQSILREPVVRPTSVFSIYDSNRESFIEGILATARKLATSQSIVFNNIQRGMQDEHSYSVEYSRICKPIEREQEDAPEDEGFAPDFTLQQWNGERSMSSVPRGNVPGAELSDRIQRSMRNLAVPPSVVQQSGESVQFTSSARGGTNMQWTGFYGTEVVETSAPAPRVSTTPSEGQSRDSERDSVSSQDSSTPPESYESRVLRGIEANFSLGEVEAMQYAMQPTTSSGNVSTNRSRGARVAGESFTPQETDAERAERIRTTYRAITDRFTP